jgi:hypothetical protein
MEQQRIMQQQRFVSLMGRARMWLSPEEFESEVPRAARSRQRQPSTEPGAPLGVERRVRSSTSLAELLRYKQERFASRAR